MEIQNHEKTRRNHEQIGEIVKIWEIVEKMEKTTGKKYTKRCSKNRILFNMLTRTGWY